MAHNKKWVFLCCVLVFSLWLPGLVSTAAETTDGGSASAAGTPQSDGDPLAQQQADAEKKEKKEQEEASHKAYSDTLPLVTQIEVQLKQIDLLTQRLDVAGAQDRDALLYRRDQRTLALVELLKKLTPLAARLPESDPFRMQLDDRVKNDLVNAGEVVYSRLAKLDERIEVITASMEGMSGAKWVETDAYLINLENLRFDYYKGLIELSQTRQQHGMESLQLLDKLPEQLFQYAEMLVGKVEFVGSAISELQNRVKANPKPNDSELTAAVQELSREHDRYTTNLRTSIELMDKLGLDSTPYRSALIK